MKTGVQGTLRYTISPHFQYHCVSWSPCQVAMFPSNINWAIKLITWVLEAPKILSFKCWRQIIEEKYFSMNYSDSDFHLYLFSSLLVFFFLNLCTSWCCLLSPLHTLLTLFMVKYKAIAAHAPCHFSCYMAYQIFVSQQKTATGKVQLLNHWISMQNTSYDMQNVNSF